MGTRNDNKSCWTYRNNRYRQNNRNGFGYKYFIGILAVIFSHPCFASDTTNVSAQPNAAITGSVANQAVQINQGSLSTQGFSRGHYCNGPVISFAPYVLQTESMSSSYATSASYGGQISLSMPLDGGAVELCKELGRRELDKLRLDYELVRIKECINIYKAGFQILPASPFYPICADIIPIAAAPKVDPNDLLKLE